MERSCWNVIRGGAAINFSRRRFLAVAGATVLNHLGTTIPRDAISEMPVRARDSAFRAIDGITLFLSGDVMLGRGIDQVLPHPSEPKIYEPYMTSAEHYVELAEGVNGRIPRPVDFAYIWGDALHELRRVQPDVRLINLETSVTKSARHEPKGINYRMNPDNVPCLTAASIDCCVLANNHVLDWGRAGLLETLDTLANVGIRTAGAGRNAAQAASPAVLDVAGKGRVVVFGFGSETSGIPSEWAAGENQPGINLLDDLSGRTVVRVASKVSAVRRPGDILVASIHWGANFGYRILDSERQFAHQLIDRGGFDVIHGHSPHHPKGIEIYKGKLILYGCGDFLNDYEGIGGYEEFRGDLALMYLPKVSISDGSLIQLQMTPFQIRRFRLNHASREDAAWLRDILDRESGKLGVRVTLNKNNTLTALSR